MPLFPCRQRVIAYFSGTIDRSLPMLIRSLPILLFTAGLSGMLKGQPATDAGDRLETAFSLAQRFLTTHPDSAAIYAASAVQLAREAGNARRGADAALLAGDIAARAGRAKEALAYYGKAWESAGSITYTDAMSRAVDQLVSINAAQGDFKAAYEWSLEQEQLAKDIRRRIEEEQNTRQQAALEALEAQKSREQRILLWALAALLGVMMIFYYNRQRANRRTRGELAEKNAMIEEKRRRSEQLLLNILPSAVAAELTVRNKVAARRYDNATVMFIDFVGFTSVAERFEPEVLIAELDYCFSRFDEMIGRNRIEKIKTVGDAYICASGLSARDERPDDMILLALRIQDFLRQHKADGEHSERPRFDARIGIHFGPVVAGVVGTKKFAYDIWGDTVNTAARMEEACEPGMVNVSGAVHEAAKGAFNWQYRGKIATKNKTELDMYFVSEKT